jgi:chromosome partitioning protein
MPVVAIANQKGGTGKTTSSINLAAGLSEKNYSVLLIDLDPQFSLSAALKVDIRNLSKGTYSLLKGEASVSELAIDTEIPGVQLIPTNNYLAAAEVEFLAEMSRESMLKMAIAEANYEYILIDCPPNLGVLTTNALAAANLVLVPVQVDYLALQGAQLLYATLKKVRQRINPTIQSRVLMTMFDGRTRHANEVAQTIRDLYGDEVFKAIIPTAVSVKEAPLTGNSLLAYDTQSVAAQAYRALAEEVIEIG